MAAKKKSAPTPLKSKALPTAKAARAAKRTKAAEPPATTSKSRASAAKASASKRAASKTPTGKPNAGKPSASKPSASKPSASKPSASKPSASKPSASKPSASKPKRGPSSDEPSLMKTMKRAAAKVAQVAAAAAVKILDADAGRAAPSFDLLDEKGERVSSSSLAGKPYLLYFYPKDDTPGCTKEACDIRDNFGRFGKQGLRVLGVSPDSQQSHAKFGKKYGLPFTLLSDPDKTLANAYGVWAAKKNYGKEYMGIVRSTFLIGADGKIKKAYRGVRVDGHVDAVLEDAKAML